MRPGAAGGRFGLTFIVVMLAWVLAAAIFIAVMWVME